LESRFINFIILSEQDGIKSYVISFRKLLYYIFLSFFLFIVIISGLVYINTCLRLKKIENDELEKTLTIEREILVTKLNTMKVYMNKISLMVDENLESRITCEPVQYGLGGGEDISTGNKSITRNDIFVSSISAEPEGKMFDEILNVEMKLEALIKNLRKMKKKLDSTPSIFPVKGIITSGFGFRKSPFTGRKELHRGIDILNDEGTSIIAPANGVVKETSENELWGLNVVLSHGYGIETQYGHLSNIVVEVGQKVKRGDIIAKLGTTGRTTGPHLHYQVWVKGTPVNPMEYIIKSNF